MSIKTPWDMEIDLIAAKDRVADELQNKQEAYRQGFRAALESKGVKVLEAASKALFNVGSAENRNQVWDALEILERLRKEAQDASP